MSSSHHNTVVSPVGDPHPEIDGPDDRSRADALGGPRGLRHRVPGMLTITGVGTFIMNFSGPASPQRHDPASPVDPRPEAAPHFRKSLVRESRRIIDRTITRR